MNKKYDLDDFDETHISIWPELPKLEELTGPCIDFQHEYSVNLTREQMIKVIEYNEGAE